MLPDRNQGSSQARRAVTSQAAAGTSEVAGNINVVTHTIDATGMAAREMLGSANQLSKQADMLRDKVAGFLGAVRAA